MSEKHVIRHEIASGYEPIKNEVRDDLPPLALAVLQERLARWREEKQPTADEIWKAWQVKHGQEQAPGRRLVHRADAVLEERGYKHRLIRRAKGERERSTTLVVYNLPVMRCPDADCASCSERVEGTGTGILHEADEGTGTGILHEQGKQADEDTALEPLQSGTPNKEARHLPVPRQNLQDKNTAYAGPATAVRAASQENTADAGPADAEREIWDDRMADDLIDELGAEGIEESTIRGMVDKGCNRKLIVNTINKQRG